MGNLSEIIIGIVLSVVCAIISFLQFQEKGFPFNVAYIFASKQEYETMDKKPHYRQSGIVFAFISSIFLCITVGCVLGTVWHWWIVGILSIALITYAIFSSIKEIRK